MADDQKMRVCSLNLPMRLFDRLDRYAQAQSEKSGFPVSRSQVAAKLLDSALEEAGAQP